MSLPSSENNDQDTKEPHEPLLKYERVSGHFHAIFKDDSLSCIALHVNFVCAGTYGGNVLLLELDGRFLRRLHQHFKKVNQVCIDETGQYIASCSDDGTVAVYSLLLTANVSSTTELKGHKHVNNQSLDIVRSTSVSSTGGEVNIYNYFSAVYAVQLEDRYAMKRDKCFACGGVSGQLVINKKGWILDKENTIHEGEGPVQLIRWKEGLVAWANDWGVKVYDSEKDQRVTFIERPPNCPPMELCKCHLEWQKTNILLIAWAHTLRVVTFQKEESKEPVSPTSTAALNTVDQPMGILTAEVVALLTFDFFIAGISPWGGSSVVSVLAYRPVGSRSLSNKSLTTNDPSIKIDGEGESTVMPYPEVHVVRLDGKQLSADLLHLKGYQHLRASNYMMPTLRYAPAQEFPLKSLSASSIYDAGYGQLAYVCTPKDVVICRLRDVDDRIQWALARNEYAKALDVALHDPRALRQVKLLDVIETYLGELLRQKQYQFCAEEIHRLFLGDEYAELWEKYVYIFAQRGHLSAIARYIPTTSPRLPTKQYDMVLKHFVDSDPGQFLELIRKWPKPRAHNTLVRKEPTTRTLSTVPLEYTHSTHVFEALYDAQVWINLLETVVRRRRMDEVERSSVETMYLTEALAELYTITEQYDHALRIYLSQGAFCSNKEFVFKLILEHQLWSLVAKKVVNLVQIDTILAIRMLVNQTEHLKIRDIVMQLENEPKMLHLYLHELVLHRFSEYNAEIYASLHEKQVTLYAKYAPDLLLPFLQTSNYVPLEKAYAYCRDHTPPLWDSMIYILGRMGHHKTALDLILNQRGDMNRAIQYVQDHDHGLWDYVIDLSLTSQENVEELLKFASQHKIDPIQLIRKIPNDMSLSNLKAKLMAIIANYRMQHQLCIGSRKVFDHDRIELLHRQIRAHKHGRRVAALTMCAICHDQLRAFSRSTESIHVCVFECGHCYHFVCLEDKMRMWRSSESSNLSRALGCFVCDHSTRAYARTSTLNEKINAFPPRNARGVSEKQLQRAKDTLLQMASRAE